MIRLKSAVIISVILHLSIIAVFVIPPGSKSSGETTYYVNLVNMPGGGGRIKAAAGSSTKKQENKGTKLIAAEQKRVKDLIVKKKPFQSKIRYPDKKNFQKSKVKKKKEEEQMVSVVKKYNWKAGKNEQKNLVVRKRRNVLSAGISTGNGKGEGAGSGDGYGDGSGSGAINTAFPYAYYIDKMKNMISLGWYNPNLPGINQKYMILITFKILRSGRAIDIKIEQSSGNDNLDNNALRSVKNAEPFPPLPGDYPDNYLIVEFEFVRGKK